MTGTLYARLAALLLAVSAAAVAVADEKGRMEAAMAAPDRLAADVERDGREHPATILALLNIGPGSRVADIFAGGGYYSELIGRVVAPDGVVLMHNNKPYVEFAAKGIVERFEGREVVGVVRHDREPDDLDLGLPGVMRQLVDHVAAAGSGEAAAQTLHRIDPAFARQHIESRGLRYIAGSDILRRPDDDHTLFVFDPEIRGKTDRFVQVYEKP